MARRYPVIDQSSLPPITLIDIPDEEVILANRMALLKRIWTEKDPPYGAQYDVENTEFDPLKIQNEVGTSFEVNGLTRINQMGRATTLAAAWGDNLDAIGAKLPGGALRIAGFAAETFVPGVPRLNKGLPNEETDERYRYRLWLAANAYSTAGAELAYVFWALTAAPTLRDVTATVQRFGRNRQAEARIVCLPEAASGIPSTDELDAVRRILALPGIKPLTEIISVTGPDIIPAALSARIWRYPGPDAAALITIVREAVAGLIEENRYLGRDGSRNAFAKVIEQPGVSRSAITFPEFVAVGQTEFLRISPVDIQLAGISE